MGWSWVGSGEAPQNRVEKSGATEYDRAAHAGTSSVGNLAAKVNASLPCEWY